jgi:DNA invertase Pin-like site-specific DNA recombinase
MSTKAFSYLRVSGASQVGGDGFPRQREAIEKYSESHCLKIVEEFREEGISGTTELDGRPALGLLFVALEENGIKTVVVEKLDRLARDLMVQETIIADMQKRGFTLISTAEPDLCSTDPSRVLMRQIFGAIAQYDKTMIVIKLRAARERIKMKTGKCGGRDAYGSKPGEAEIAIEMRAMRDSGHTYLQIATKLNNQGKLARSGGTWTAQTVGKILHRGS